MIGTRLFPGRSGPWLIAALFFGLTLIGLIVPMIVGVLWSLVNPRAGWFPPNLVPPSLSLDNWRAMFSVPEMGEAAVASFTIAPLVTALCAALALPTGFALGRRAVPFRRAIEFLVLAPIIMPGIVIATGLGSMFIRFGPSPLPGRDPKHNQRDRPRQAAFFNNP